MVTERIFINMLSFTGALLETFALTSITEADIQNVFITICNCITDGTKDKTV